MNSISALGSAFNTMYGTAGLTKSSGASATLNASGTGAAWSNKMTISDIRDQVDLLATSGQLTTQQQMALITAGLQDLNAGDKSYQPAQVGLTRDTKGTFDASALMQQRSEFDLAQNDTAMAKLNQSLADMFSAKENTTFSAEIAAIQKMFYRT